MVRKSLIAVFVLAIVFSVSFANALVKEGEKAPQFQITTITGDKVNTEDLRGNKAVFLVFWATWCRVCTEDMPLLKEVYSEMEAKPIQFLAINPGVRDNLNRIKRYIEIVKIPFPVALDQGAPITKSYGVVGAPSFVLIDKKGVVRFSGGQLPKNWRKLFASVLE